MAAKRRQLPPWLLVALAAIVSVALAITVNAATGGTLPAPLEFVERYAWWFVAVLTLLASLITVYQSRLEARDDISAIEERDSAEARLRSSQERLATATSEVREELHDFSRTLIGLTDEEIETRQQRVSNLETLESDLISRTRELESHVRVLEGISREERQEITKIWEEQQAQLARQQELAERRSARRDYFLFSAGLIAGTVISIVLKLIGLA